MKVIHSTYIWYTWFEITYGKLVTQFAYYLIYYMFYLKYRFALCSLLYVLFEI